MKQFISHECITTVVHVYGWHDFHELPHLYVQEQVKISHTGLGVEELSTITMLNTPIFNLQLEQFQDSCILDILYYRFYDNFE